MSRVTGSRSRKALAFSTASRSSATPHSSIAENYLKSCPFVHNYLVHPPTLLTTLTHTHTDTHTHRHTDTHTHTHTHTCIRLRLPLFGGFRQKRRSEGGENKRCSNSSQRSCFHMPFEHCVLVAGAPSERENRNQLRCGGGEQRPPPPPPQHNMKTSPFQEEEKATNSHCSC